MDKVQVLLKQLPVKPYMCIHIKILLFHIHVALGLSNTKIKQ